jgi:hypothetical protein
MYKFINLNPNKSKYIYGKKLLQTFKYLPYIFIETTNQYQFPYWQGDDIKKRHFKYFKQYCTDYKHLYSLVPTPDDIIYHAYEVTYMNRWRIKIYERFNKLGQTIQMTIGFIYNWSIYKVMDDLINRFNVSDPINPEYNERLICELYQLGS